MIEKLVAGGVNVQLKHDATETSWESHGWVSITLDGTELCRSEDVQYNYSTRMEKMEELVVTTLSAFPAGAKVDRGAIDRIKMAKGGKLAAGDDNDMILAFVALGGKPDKTGTISTEKLKQTCKVRVV